MVLSMKLNKENESKKEEGGKKISFWGESGTAPACSAAANSEGFGAAAAGGFYARQFLKVGNIIIMLTAWWLPPFWLRELSLVSNQVPEQ